MGKYSVVDLFAGAGGLSLGFMQTQMNTSVSWIDWLTEEITPELMCKEMYAMLIIMKLEKNMEK